MNQRRHLTVIAAAATLLSSIPLEILFAEWGWLVQSTLLVAIICAAMIGARALRTPVWAQPLIGLVAVLFGLTWLQASGHAYAGLIPDADTFRQFGSLVNDAGSDINQLAIPAPSTPGLLFLTTAGIGVCAVLVDLLAVGLRRPALAGLPMLAIYTVPVEIDPKSVPVLVFALGACGFLWLLVSDNIDRVRLFGRRFTGDGRGVDMWETSPLASVGRRIAAVGVVCAVLLPAALPGLGSGLIGQLGDGNGLGGSGNCRICTGPSSVNLFANLHGHLTTKNPTTMATVTTDSPSPEYLRFGVADQLTAAGFSSSTPSGGPLNQQQTDPSKTAVSGLTYTKHHASVTIEDLRLNLLPIYATTLANTIGPISNKWAVDPDTDVVFSRDNTTKNMTYKFDYEQPAWDPSQLRLAPRLPDNSALILNDAKVPVSVPLVNSVVDKQTAGTTNEYDAVMALYHYFAATNDFTYKVTTQSGTTGTDIGDFLQKKQGYCVQYAAALAWLVRADHYPARVAFGFTIGSAVSSKSSGVTYDLSSLDLHAWTEVYFQNFGWVPFDATPSSGLTGSVQTAWAPGTDAPSTPTTPVGTPSSSTSAGVGGGRAPGDKPTIAPVHPTTATATQKSTPLWVWAILVIVALAVVALVSPLLTRLSTRRRRSAIERGGGPGGAEPGEPWVIVEETEESEAMRRRAHTAWAEFMDTLVDYDVPIDVSETPRTTAERVVATTELSPGVADGVRIIGSSEQLARYARQPGSHSGLDQKLRHFRRELAGNVSFGTKMRAVLLPPSVVNRWRAVLSNRVIRTVGGVQSTHDAIGGRLNLRRWLSAPRRLLAGKGGR